VTDPPASRRARAEASAAGEAPDALRASDADRDRVAEVLREAAAYGRISLDELDERLDLVYAAKTYGELEPVTRDLPEHAPPRPDGAFLAGKTPYGNTFLAGKTPYGNTFLAGKTPYGNGPQPAAFPAGRIGGTPGHPLLLAVMSANSRRGRWVVPRRHLTVALMGRVHLDLRDAYFAEPEVTIRVVALLGRIRVTVPEGVEVEVSGLELMGAVRRKASGPGLPGGPRVRIVGLALMGEVNVRRKGKVLPGRGLAGKARRALG
jgi:hypothetical protein